MGVSTYHIIWNAFYAEVERVVSNILLGAHPHRPPSFLFMVKCLLLSCSFPNLQKFVRVSVK